MECNGFRSYLMADTEYSKANEIIGKRELEYNLENVTKKLEEAKIKQFIKEEIKRQLEGGLNR